MTNTMQDSPHKESNKIEHTLEEGTQIEKKTSFSKQKDKFLNDIGIIGWKNLSTPIMASLLTGLPIAFVGDPGTAKTHLPDQIRKYWLACEIAIVDASKCEFEELIGPYNLKKYEQGIIEYLATPQAIWKKRILFIDEMNRAVMQVQNGFLELVRQGTLVGMETDIDYKWAACNYLSDDGTQPITPALADRFAFTLHVPNAQQLGDENLRKIANHGADFDDKVVSKYIPNRKRFKDQYRDMTQEIEEYLIGVGKEYSNIEDKLNIKQYCVNFTVYYMSNLTRDTSKGKKPNPYIIGARRMNQMISVITAGLAVELYEYNSYIKSLPIEQRQAASLTTAEKTSWLQENILRLVLMNVNTALTGKDVDQKEISAAHAIALKQIDAADLGQDDPVYKIAKENDPTKRFFRALCLAPLAPLEAQKVFEEIEQAFNLNQSNMFGVKPPTLEEVELHGYDTLIPFIFLATKKTPFQSLLNNLTPELQDKIRLMTQFCYQYKLIEDCDRDGKNDLETYFPDIYEFVRKTKFNKSVDDDPNFPLRNTFDLPADTKFEDVLLKEFIFRRFVVDEGQLSIIALCLGEGERTKDDAKRKEFHEKKQLMTSRFISTNFAYIAKKVEMEWNKAKQVLLEEGYQEIFASL